MKIVPAGVSRRTGQHYNSFEACSNRECTYKPPQSPRTPLNKQETPKLTPTASNENTRLLSEILETLKFILEVVSKKDLPY